MTKATDTQTPDLHILVLHGPNLNLLGRREVGIYGKATLAQIDQSLHALAVDLGVGLKTLQSNHEGGMVDALHEAAGYLLVGGKVQGTGRASHLRWNRLNFRRAPSPNSS